MPLILSLEYHQPPIITIAQYLCKCKQPHNIFNILHATCINGCPNIACWISKCPPPVTSQTYKHCHTLANISHTHNPQYHKPSIMSSTLQKQQKADDKENQVTQSCTQNVAKLGSALLLWSTVNSIAEDENPIPVIENASVVSAFNMISEAPLLQDCSCFIHGQMSTNKIHPIWLSL